MARGTRHCNLVVLIRNRTIGAYVVVVVVILNMTSWLSSYSSVSMVTSLLVHSSSVGRGFEGRAARSREEEGGSWELYHSNILAKSTLFSKPQTAALKHNK